MIRWSRYPLCFRVAMREFRAISRSYAVLLVLVGGVFFYGLLYNYMYAPNVVHGVPIAVVDHSHTALSRRYIRLIDATPEVSVSTYAEDMLAAKQQMLSGQVFGVLYLPHDFEQRLYRGEVSVFPFYASTDAFLYYEALERANLQVMEAMDGMYRMQLVEFLTPQELLAVASRQAVEVVGTALYNPDEGYGIYLIPSVLMIIIFQTLMMLVAMMAGNESKRRLLEPYGRLRRSRIRTALSLVCGKSATYLVLYGIFAFFLIGFLPLVFNIPHRASGYALAAMLVPYICATSFLGLTLSRWYTDAEAPILIIAFFSIGLIFLSGVSYPLELMPWYWQAVHYIVPAAPAVLAFVKLNSMGASLADVQGELLVLYIQAIVYLFLAVAVYKGKLHRVSSDKF